MDDQNTRRPERDSLDDQKTRARGSFGRPKDQKERFSLDDQKTRARDFLWTTRIPEDQREIPWTTRRLEREVPLNDQKARTRGSFGQPEDQRFPLDNQKTRERGSFGRPVDQKERFSLDDQKTRDFLWTTRRPEREILWTTRRPLEDENG